MMENILLLHGALGSKEQFAALSVSLENKFNVHTLNFYGHGGGEFSGEFSISSFACQVSCYMDENNISPAHIFGHSMGGYVGIYLAKHYPAKVKQVITLATKFSWSPEIAAREAQLLDAGQLEL